MAAEARAPEPGAAEEGRAGRWGWLALLVILLGIALRLYRLGSLPPGLNSDEAAAGIEALGLLRDGMDRWGNPWPVYFPGWGSGLNALYSYLTVPVIWLRGLDVLSVRLVNAVFGCLTLPLVWLVARREFGPGVALVATAMVALLPWHVMLSRWALESNLLPFWFTLGLLTLGSALRPGARPWHCVLAFLPWAVGVYAYAAAVAPMALSALLILAFHWRVVLPRLGWWALGALLALLVDAPFLLFLLKNQVLHRALGVESWLPFSVPLFPSSRLAQAQGPVFSILRRNLTFVLDAWRDGLYWNHPAGFAPLTGIMPWLTLLGAIEAGRQVLRGLRPGPVFLAALSLLGVFPLFVFNINRINWFFVPAVILAAHGLLRLHAAFRPGGTRTAFVAATALYFAATVGAFLYHYVARYPVELAEWEDAVSDGFRIGYRGVMQQAIEAAAPGETVLLEPATYHPYVWNLFYGFGDLDSFRRTRRLEVRDGMLHVSGFDRFAFDRDALPPGRPFTFAVRRESPLPCAAPRLLPSDPMWRVGQCTAPGG